MSFSAPRFRKSSFSGMGGCVEVARLPASGHFAVRDSKNPELEARVFTLREWNAFIDGVKAGEFDPETL
ncbi:DUF397 domain-containing protein [Actinomycetospora sp. C-140]